MRYVSGVLGGNMMPRVSPGGNTPDNLLLGELSATTHTVIELLSKLLRFQSLISYT